MKTHTPALTAHLATGGPFIMADLYTLWLASGLVLRWTSFDVPLIWGGATFSADGPVLKRGNTRIVLGLEVDTLDLTLYPRASDLINGLPLLQAARAGAFDGCMLRLERAFLTPAFAVIGTDKRFYGRFADLDATRQEIAIRVNSPVEQLNIQLPKNLVSAGCHLVLYGPACGLNRVAWSRAATVAAGSTRSLLNCGLAWAARHFERGYVEMTSGDMAGVKRTVKSYSPGVVVLQSPLPATPAMGDSFQAYPGCDKQMPTCDDKFGNLGRFRGMPFVPVPETAV